MFRPLPLDIKPCCQRQGALWTLERQGAILWEEDGAPASQILPDLTSIYQLFGVETRWQGTKVPRWQDLRRCAFGTLRWCHLSASRCCLDTAVDFRLWHLPKEVQHFMLFASFCIFLLKNHREQGIPLRTWPCKELRSWLQPTLYHTLTPEAMLNSPGYVDQIQQAGSFRVSFSNYITGWGLDLALSMGSIPQRLHQYFGYGWNWLESCPATTWRWLARNWSQSWGQSAQFHHLSLHFARLPAPAAGDGDPHTPPCVLPEPSTGAGEHMARIGEVATQKDSKRFQWWPCS